MSRIITLCTAILFFALANASAQTFISGVINSYAKVNAIHNEDPCAPYIIVDDASSFMEDGHVMIIQMKGAEIDTTESGSFGNLLNLNSAGLYEKTKIDYITNDTIYFSTQFIHDYDVDASVQIVDIPQYTDVTVSAAVYADPWDGEKGGIIAMEVQGVLTLNDKIDASQVGFRGAIRDTLDGFCSWNTQLTGYAYPDNDWRGGAKGEGIAEFVMGKENGRGPQGTGGGGGNDHNSGGGGGSNFGTGGAGGQNLTPTPLACIGLYPGIGGYANPSFGDRLFMGGGGGAGHDNNNTGSNGGTGGGIIYIKANQINANWNNILARGETMPPTIAFDGGGGGGAGGSILVDAQLLYLGLTLSVRGGGGSSANAISTNRCMGPGGGGGGGAIFTGLASPTLYTYAEGGTSGLVINSTSICNNTSNNATAGADGLLLPLPATFPEGPTIIHMNLTNEPDDAVICDTEAAGFSVSTDLMADTYQWQIDDGSGYADLMDGSSVSGANTANLNISGLAEGSYMVQCLVTGGCNDSLTTMAAVLEVSSTASISLQPQDQTICEDEPFVLEAEATGNNVTYQWQVNDGSGFVDVVDGAAYMGGTSNMLSVQTNLGMDGYQFQCVASNDCPGSATSDPATITVMPLPAADFGYTIVNDTLFVTNTSSNTTDYYWDFGDRTPLQPGGAPYYVYEESGTYTVTVYAVNDCGTVSQSYEVSVVLTNVEEILDNAFIISPNPTRGSVNISFSGISFDQAQVSLYDASGRVVLRETMADDVLLLDLADQSSGIYILQIKTGEQYITKKIVKQ
jgi:PKD repeat protein